MNDKRKLLLKKAAENNGRLTTGMAMQLYASKDSATSALASLEFQNYIENKVPGVFRVVALPDDVKQQIRRQDSSESGEKSSDFKKEPVTH